MEGNEESISKGGLSREPLLKAIRMIFVTVGTHEQPFDRLIRQVDKLKRDGAVKEEVIMQTGYCTYAPQYCTWNKLYPYDEITELIKSARIVITHGGPSSFMAVLQEGKIPIVVPRKKKYGEHVNDHQTEFCRQVQVLKGGILLVEEEASLGDTIGNYDALSAGFQNNTAENREIVLRRIESMAEQLMQSR